MYIVELTPTTGQQARGGIALAWAIFNDFTNLMSLEAKIEKKKKEHVGKSYWFYSKARISQTLGSTSALFSSCSMAKAKQNIWEDGELSCPAPG